MPRSAAIFEKKTEFFINRAIFPVKSKLQKPIWLQGYGINLEKVNSFILEQIRIIEFCSFDHLFRFKAAYSVTMNIFRKKKCFFLNHL